ncbi:hypothetical protein IFM89_000416 [Coptis chinensis]|uniref:Separase n=1 Tax=Coptis chinensis TaxID=261450 RepID=A0A835I8F4_9MAGN|nr:hypothetical protein IFM89_000416 [Coptis chinensis]
MASVSEASIISRLDKSDYRNLRQDFLQYLKPLSNLVTFNYDHDSTNNNNNVKNQKTIRQLANKFLQFLNRALKYLPIRLNELQKSDRETALDLFCMYKVCLACSKFLSPYLENKPFQVHVQSLYLVLSYEAWGMYVDAEVESFRILESLRSVYYSPKIEQDTSCLLPDVNLHEDPGLASLIVKVVQTIVSCAFKSLRKEDAVYKRVLSLVHQARPWFRLLDSKTFDILHYSLVTNLYSCTVRILEEDACLDGDLVDLFCMTTITEHLKSSANNHLLVRASNICLTIISQQRSRSSLIVHILTCVLDFIACDCKVGVKFTVNECLDVVHNIVKKCRCASTDSCRYVGQNLVEIASNFREVSPPFSSILELYAAGLCYTENSLQPSCIGSEGLLSESLITLPIRGGDDLLYLNDVLRSLADYFHGGSNSCVSCECSVSCKHEHGRVSFLSYLKALAFFCHPFAELVTSASNTLLPEKKFPTFSPNLTIILDAFQQYSDACHSHFSCRSEREMGNFDYTQGKLHLVVIAALIVSLWTNKNVKASDMLNICCRSAWTCINNLEARSEALSEEAISHYVTKTCSRSGTLLLALHECGSTDLIEVVITTLSNCSTVANLFENLDGPTNLMRQWVKFVCKDYKDADTCDNAPLVYPRLSKYLKEKNFSTTITMRTTRIILEQELLAYEQMEENYINLCQTMQLKITEILLGEVYVRNDLQRSKVLIKKGRLLRACGIGDLECCIGCLSEAISILSVNQLDVSVESTSNCSQVSDLLAVAYCLRALCTQEVPQPNSKVILEDIQSAVELWMSIDRYENFNRELATDYKIPLLCCVADLLSVKGHFQLQSDIYTLIIVLLKRKGVPVQKCFAMLWTDRRLSHALCTKSIDEDAILCLAKHFGTCFDPNSIGTWVTCLKDSQPLLLVGFRQKFSLYDSILTQHGHFPPGSCLGSNVTVGEVKEVASTLNSNVHKTTSNFLLGYLYHDLCERLISSGQLVEVLPLHFDSDHLFEMDTLGESHVSVQGPQATTTPQSITSERLNGINFKTWSRSVVHYLTSKGVEGLVDGTYARPAVTDEKKYTQWKKHNSMVIGWLFNSMDTPIVQMFLYHDFVYDLWSSLKETYSSKSNGSRVFQLYREVHSTSQGDRSAAEYFAQLQTRWEEIDHHEVIVELTGEAAMLVAKRADKQKVFAFLMGLRPEFETLGGQIVNTRPLIGLSILLPCPILSTPWSILLPKALLFAKKALHLRSLLLRDKFVCRFWTAPLKTIDYNHAEVEVLGSVATEVWPNGRLWNIEQCNLSQWSVLRCYLESILQVGVIHEALGNASLAEFLFLRGKKISFEEELPIFRVAFASALGDIYCKKQLWDLAKTELTRGREILVNSSTSLISCKLCKLTLGVTIDHRFGDLARKHSDGTGTSLLNKTSNALGLYKKALKKLKLFAWNLESEPNVRMTRSRSRTSYNRNMKFPNEVESKCLKVSSENSIFGCPSSHCWMEPNMPSRTEVGSTEMTVCNRKNCWKCLLQKVMETENTKDFISMKCEFHRRRLCLRLLTAIGICVGESGKVYEMHEIFWQCIMMLFDQRTFCETFSGSHSLFLEVIGNKWQCDLFATERAAILYNLSWFSLKNIHSGNTCCDLSRIQLPSIISWLLQAFILSREIPLYFQKVSKLLATVFLLSTSTERFHLPLYPGNTLCGCHWAAFFHQASLGTYFNQQLCDPNVLKLVKPVDFEVCLHLIFQMSLIYFFRRA